MVVMDGMERLRMYVFFLDVFWGLGYVENEGKGAARVRECCQSEIQSNPRINYSNQKLGEIKVDLRHGIKGELMWINS